MIVPEFIMHPASRKQLDLFAANPAHAVIVAGPEGIGKSMIARQLAIQLLGLADEVALAKSPHLKIVEPDGPSISIETVRELQQFTKLKVAGKGRQTQRIVIIRHADLLTTEAQNALLKSLEEPPAGIVFILTAARSRTLLPTIRSRVQMIDLHVPAQAEIQDYFVAAGHSTTAVIRAHLMSGGLPALMHAMLTDDAEHPLVQATKQARELLQANTFERLALVDKLARQREESTRLLFMLQQMAHVALVQAADKNSGNTQLARWQRILRTTHNAEAALLASAQPKLVFTKLMLEL